MEPEGFVYDITSDGLALNVIPSSESTPSNCKSCIKTSPPSISSSSSPSGSNRRSIRDQQPCPGHQLFGSGRYNGESFWKSLQRNVRKYMECFRPVAGRPKDAGRVQPIKLAGNAWCCGVRNAEEHDENLKALILHCKNS